MKLQEGIKELMKEGTVLVGEKLKCDGQMHFLFGYKGEIYYVRDETFNMDKMELAIHLQKRPHLLDKTWWTAEWEVYKGKFVLGRNVW